MAFVTSAAASLRPAAARAATSTAAVGRRDGAFVQPLRTAARVAAPRATVSMKSAEQQAAEVCAICGARSGALALRAVQMPPAPEGWRLLGCWCCYVGRSSSSPSVCVRLRVRAEY